MTIGSRIKSGLNKASTSEAVRKVDKLIIANSYRFFTYRSNIMTDEKILEIREKMDKEWRENKPITHRQLIALTELIMDEVIAPLKERVRRLEAAREF